MKQYRGTRMQLLMALSWVMLAAAPSLAFGPGPLNNGGWIPPDAKTKRCEAGALGIAAKLFSCIATCREKAAMKLLADHPFDEKACVEGPSAMGTSCFEKYDKRMATLTSSGACATANQCLDATALRGAVETAAAPVLSATYCSAACGTANLPCCAYPPPNSCSSPTLACVNCSSNVPNSIFKCLPCGGELEACCAGNACDNGLPCEIAPLCSAVPVLTCRCGFQGDPCCTGPGHPACFLTYTCNAGTCQ